MKRFLFLLGCGICLYTNAQSFRFAFVSDTHIGNETAAEDLRRTVQDINSDTSLRFVVISGDITEFGSDDELALAKQILDSLKRPWYLVPGNHDSNWSESGSNSFKKIFGAETFRFIHEGYLFLGTASGPNMRMSPGQVPREHIVWLDSSLKNMRDTSMPVIFMNHYPQDTSLNNWYEITDRLKTRNIQLILCGHGHSNRNLSFEGIPAVMGRSNLRARQPYGGYNIVTFENGTAFFRERNPVTKEEKGWTQVSLQKRNFLLDTTHYYRPSYAGNATSRVKERWSFQSDSDIGSGMADAGKWIVATNTGGAVFALKKTSGKKTWSVQTGGKIYSTPAVAGKRVVVASTDGNIYCMDAKTGKQNWTFETGKPIVASPLIHQGMVFIGSSEGIFRALDLETGRLLWQFDSVRNFVSSTPLFYKGRIFFGSWGTELYALEATSGVLAWKWNNGSSNRMFSPAACVPAASFGKIFIVAPDRHMTALDGETGNVISRKQIPGHRVRESIGISADTSLLYAKTMDGSVIGISTASHDLAVMWTSETDLGYELAPTAITEYRSIVYVPSDAGVVAAVDRANGSVRWKYKISNCLISGILPQKGSKVIVSTMDGKIVLLK